MRANPPWPVPTRAPVRLLAHVFACLLVGTASARAQPVPAQGEPAFAAVAFHDVVDARNDLDDDAVTTNRLVGFFDWLRGNGWSAISLDDVDRARRGEKALPAKAILLTFDDGYRSLYTRVYPLALAYGYPIVSALVGEWMDVPAGSAVNYGDHRMPREGFITWAQAREMQRSGLVEFASHSQDLHNAVMGNPQGNVLPAAVTRRYTPGAGYQDEAAFAQTIRRDLEHQRATMTKELGRAPRAVVWPYGRYNAIGIQVVRDLGFDFALTLDEGPSVVAEPWRLARHLPTHDPPLGDLVQNLRPDPNERRVDRLVCLDPAALWTADEATSNERLGRAIERARSLGVSGLVVDAVLRDPQGRISAAWFPTRELPLAGDWLSRVAWQMRTRGGVKVYVRLPHAAALAALGDAARVRRLYEDLGSLVPLDGWLLEDTEAPAQPMHFDDPPALYEHRFDAQPGWSSWVVRARRQSMMGTLTRGGGLEALGWQAFAILDAARPGLKLLWLAPTPAVAGPHPLADISLRPSPLAAPIADDCPARVNPLVAPWFVGPEPADARVLAAQALDVERHGGVSLGWCPDDPLNDLPAAAVAARGVSTATFPVRR
jgi:peptidoglycan/xylan/chitin deacetylase (PgdA/CDA1 family)